MPRRPKKSGHLLPRPFAFSPFARTVARTAPAYSVKHEVCDPKPHRKCSSKLKANGSGKDIISANDSESDEEKPEEVIQADFAFFDPKPDDFHGVKTLLQNYLDDKEWDLSDFVDIIIAQTTVGSTVKIEDDEDEGLFAFLTTLNLRRYKDHKCIAEVKNYLLKVCVEKDVVFKLKLLLEEQSEDVGLIVSQRVTNLPPQLLPHLYDALFDEISWATEDEPTEDLRGSFHFKHYLLLTRIYKRIANCKNGSTSNIDDGVVYVKAEDELFHELCSWSFTFSLKTHHPVPPELKGYRLMGLVLAVEADKVPTFRQKLRSLIDVS